jgi:hypothetical protein
VALTKPFAQTKTDDFEEIPEVPDAIKRDQWKRPLIQPKDGGPEVAYTRASTLGKAIDDTYHLNRWEIRAVVLGMSRREELVARAAAIPENEGEYRDALQEIGAEAKTAGGGDRGANIGTALHKLSERRDAGEDLSYLPGVLMEAMDAYGELMADFEVLASETFVACDPLQTAGTFDRVVRLLVDLEFRHAVLGRVIIPAGTVLVLDLKTGKLESAKYWGPTYGVQQVVYACGDPYTGKGRMTWEELLGEGVIPSTRWAVLLHVPSDSPKDAGLVIVDLDAAAEMADLCLEIRAARKNKGLMSDAFPVKPKPAAIETADDVEEEVSEFGVRIAAVLGQIATAVAEADFDELYELNEDIWTDEFTAAVKARIHDLYSDDPQAAAPTDLLTEEEIEVEVPAQVAQVRKTGLIASLRYAKSEAVIEKIWEQNQDIWDADCNRMVKARLAELEAESVPA